MKIAVIRFSSLGDVILSSVVLQPLYEAGHEITFITFKPFDQLFVKDYRIKNLIALNKTDLKSVNQIKKFTKSLKNQDLILDLHSNLRSFLISKFSSKKTLRYDKKSIKRRLFTKPFIKNFINLKDFNVLDAYLQPLKKIGIKNLENYRPRIIIDEEDSINIPLPEDFIVISTGARYKGKIYPYFKEVIEKIDENVVLIGSKEDRENDKNIYKNVLDLRGKLNLRQSLYVISQAKFTISNDSAVAHMSRAVSTPVLVLYGATHPYFGFAPKKDEGSYIFADLKCQPCDLHGKKECKYKDYRCFKQITPDIVIKKYENLKNK